MIDFGDLQADLPTYENSGALVVDNVLPLAKGYKSLAGFQALSGTGLTVVLLVYLQVLVLVVLRTILVTLPNFIRWTPL